MVVAAITFGFGHRTLDVRLFAPSLGSPARRLVFGTLQSLGFALRSRAFAFVCAQFSLVRHALAVVCDPISLVGDPVPLGREPLASGELSLASRQSLLALIKLCRTAVEILSPSNSVVVTVLSFHDSGLCWRAP